MSKKEQKIVLIKLQRALNLFNRKHKGEYYAYGLKLVE